MPDMPDEDEPIGFDAHGHPITLRTMREAHEEHRMRGVEFLTSIRRLFDEELTLPQLVTVQALFTELGRIENPAIAVSWWEGQIDMIVWQREREAAFADAAGPIPESLLDLQVDDEAEEVESAVVEGTLDRHDYTTGLDPHGVPCVFTSTVNGIGTYVCGLPPVAAPHSREA